MDKLRLPIKLKKLSTESFLGIPESLIGEMTSLYSKSITELLQHIYEMDALLELNERRSFGDYDFSVKKLPLGLVFEDHASGWWGCVISYNYGTISSTGSAALHDLWLVTGFDKYDDETEEKDLSLRNKFISFMSELKAEDIFQIEDLVRRSYEPSCLRFNIRQIEAGEAYSHSSDITSLSDFKFPLLFCLKTHLSQEKDDEEDSEETVVADCNNYGILEDAIMNDLVSDLSCKIQQEGIDIESMLGD